MNNPKIVVFNEKSLRLEELMTRMRNFHAALEDFHSSGKGEVITGINICPSEGS